MTTNETRTYFVAGMTCGHCRASVQEEVGELAGVEDVSVDLDSGRLDVTGPRIDDDAVARAVEEAGYRLAEAP
jgi:copper chaperone